MRNRRSNHRGLMGVSKKDFIAIADVLCTTGASDATSSGLARYFGSQNAAFNATRFMAATKACKR